MTLQEQLRRRIQEICLADIELSEALRRLRARTALAGRAGNEAGTAELTNGAAPFAAEVAEFNLLRPVFGVSGGRPVLTHSDTDGDVWKTRLEQAGEPLLRAIRAVGRFEVENRPGSDDGGTGVLVRHDVVVTNHHVAKTFAGQEGAVFRISPVAGGGRLEPFIDFSEEPVATQSRDFRIVGVLHLQEDENPDIALLQVEPVGSAPLPTHIPLAREVKEGQRVAAIGFPMEDVSARHADDLKRIFQGEFNKKRVAPGEIQGVRDGRVLHDCSVLSGNSGSPLVNLDTGEVVALHFSGEFAESGVAVPAPLIIDLLGKVGRQDETDSTTASAWTESGAVALAPPASAPAPVPAPAPVSAVFTISIPLKITVVVDAPVVTRSNEPASGA